MNRPLMLAALLVATTFSVAAAKPLSVNVAPSTAENSFSVPRFDKSSSFAFVNSPSHLEVSQTHLDTSPSFSFPAPPFHLDKAVSSPSLPVPAESIEPDSPGAFRSAFTQEYLRHQHERLQVARLRLSSSRQSLDAAQRPRAVAPSERGAPGPNSQHFVTNDQAERLARINYVRSHGYHVNIGQNVAFGTRWDYQKFGPYPADRLAKLEATGNGDRDKLRTELDNAWEALDRQLFMDAKGTMGDRLVYTDDLYLLRSSFELYEAKLRWLQEAVRDGVEHVRG